MTEFPVPDALRHAMPLRRSGTHVTSKNGPRISSALRRLRRIAPHPGHDSQCLQKLRSLERSRQSALSFSIKAIFQARRQRFNACSRALA